MFGATVIIIEVGLQLVVVFLSVRFAVCCAVLRRAGLVCAKAYPTYEKFASLGGGGAGPPNLQGGKPKLQVFSELAFFKKQFLIKSLISINHVFCKVPSIFLLRRDPFHAGCSRK